MKGKEFDDKIKNLVESAVETGAVRCDGDMWFRIESGLIRRKRMMILKRVSYVAVAASLVIGAFLIVPSGGEAPIVLTEASNEIIEKSEGTFIEKEFIAQNDIESKANVQDAQKDAKAPQEENLYVKEDPSIKQSTPQPSQKEAPKESSKRKAQKKEYRTIYDQIGESSYFAIAEDVKKEKRYLIFGLSSNIAAVRSLSGNMPPSPHFSSGQGSGSNYGIVHDSPINNSLPLTFGVQLQIGLGEKLGVGIGANYSFLHSRYEAIIDGADQAIVDQSLHYVGVPLNLYYSILQNNSMKFYVSGGGMLEKGLQVNYKILNPNNTSTRRTDGINGLQWSVNVGLGFEYKIVHLLGIYIDPSVSYFFESDQPYSIRTDQPLQFRVEVGFRFHL